MAHPGYARLIEDDGKTVKCLVTSAEFSRTLAPLRSCASQALTDFRRDSRAFAFWGAFKTLDPHDGKTEHTVHVGANLSDREHTATYKIVVTINQEPVRMVHFDYEAFANRSVREAKPSMHIQLGGIPPPQILKTISENKFDRFFPNVEKVRIFAFPVSLGIVLHWLFMEYRAKDEALRRVSNSAGWLKRVKESERLIFLPFLECCEVGMRHGRHNSKALLELLYEL